MTSPTLLWFARQSPPIEDLTTRQYSLRGARQYGLGLICGAPFSENARTMAEAEVMGMIRLHLVALTDWMTLCGIPIADGLSGALDHQIEGDWTSYWRAHPPAQVISRVGTQHVLSVRWAYGDQVAVAGVARNTWVSCVLPADLLGPGGGVELDDLMPSRPT